MERLLHRKGLIYLLTVCLAVVLAPHFGKAADGGAERGVQGNPEESKALKKVGRDPGKSTDDSAPEHAKKEHDILEAVGNSAARLEEALKEGEDTARYVDDIVRRHGAAIAGGEKEAESFFQKVEGKLKEVGGLKENSPILSRHQAVSKEYAEKVAELRDRIRALKEAQEKRTSKELLQQKVQDLVDFTEKHKTKTEYELH